MAVLYQRSTARELLHHVCREGIYDYDWQLRFDHGGNSSKSGLVGYAIQVDLLQHTIVGPSNIRTSEASNNSRSSVEK